MADFPGGPSSEYLADREALARALLDRQTAPRVGGYAGGIAEILRAIAGHSNLNWVEQQRRAQIAARGASRLPPAPSVPPVPGGLPGSQIPAQPPMYQLGPAAPVQPPQSAPQAPTQSLAPAPQAPIQPLAPAPQAPIQPLAPAPQSAPQQAPQPTVPQPTPQRQTALPATPTQGLVGALPAEVIGVPPEVARRVNAQRTNVLSQFGRMTGRRADANHIYMLSKFPVGLVADVVNRPNAPLLQLLKPYFNNDEAATHQWMNDNLPGIGSPGGAPVTGQDFISYQSRINPPQQPNEAFPGRLGLGGPVQQETLPSVQPTPQENPEQMFGNIPAFIATDPLVQEIQRSQPPIRPSPVNNTPQRPARTRVAQLSGGGTGIGTDVDTLERNIVQPQQQQDQWGGVFPRIIPVDPGLVHELGNLHTIPPDQRAQVLERANQPMIQKNQFGTAYYSLQNIGNGQLAWVRQQVMPERQEIPPGGPYPGILTPGGQINIPRIGVQPPGQQPPGQQPPGQQPPGQEGNLLNIPPHPVTGGGGTGDIARDVREWEANVQIESEAARQLSAAHTGAINEYVKDAALAVQRLQTLGSLEAATRIAGRNAWRGPYVGEFMQALNQVLSNFPTLQERLQTIMPSIIADPTTLANTQIIGKIIIELGGQATRELSNRPANFEFQTYLRAFPGLVTSYEGALMLIDILRQEQEKKVELGQRASELPPRQRGQFNRQVREYYAQNPTIVTVPDGVWLRQYGLEGQGPIRITTQPIRTRRDAENLPSDLFFFGPSGRLGRGGGGPIQPQR